MTALRIALAGDRSRMMFRGAMTGNAADEHGRNDGKVLGHIVCDAEGGQSPACHEHLLADLDDLDELGGVRIEIHHVAGLLGSLRARVHGNTHVGLGKGRGIVGAVAGHGNQMPRRLLLPDERQLVLRPGLRQEVIDPGLFGDGCGGKPVIARNHDGFYTHGPESLETVLQASFDDVFEVDDPQHPLVCRQPREGFRRIGRSRRWTA